jgi:hypothetical protein
VSRQQRIDIRQSRFAAAISKAEVYLRGDCELRGILGDAKKGLACEPSMRVDIAKQ